MKQGTTKHPHVGKRVEIPPYYDLWMRGARFGTVARVIIGTGATLFAVRMDHPQVKRMVRVIADDCRFV